MAYLYVFVDESGNDDFSPTGTRFWALTSLITEDIKPGVLELYDLKHRLIDLGTDIEYFHAAEDRQVVRDEVFKIIKAMPNLRVDSLIVRKNMTAPAVRDPSRFYPEMVNNLLQFPFDPRGVAISRYEKVFFFFDRFGATTQRRKALIAGIKKYLARHLKGLNYHITMHPSMSHPYLQIVDYISWAIYVRWERKEERPLQEIDHFVKSQFDIFANGKIAWY